jgi:hypothetical protein
VLLTLVLRAALTEKGNDLRMSLKLCPTKWRRLVEILHGVEIRVRRQQ